MPNIQTLVVGVIVAIGLFFAVRHVYRNFRDGKEDCAGNCGGCGGSCSSCHPPTAKN